MLQTNEMFAEIAGVEINGLKDEAYKGSNYGNPPFDGIKNGTNTIIQTLDKAQEASVTKSLFIRVVFFLQLTDKTLKERLKHPRAKLLMKFPNDSIPFIPDNHWYGRPRQAGCYKEKHTRLVLLTYESENLGHLNFNYQSLHKEMSSRFIHTTPARNHNRKALEFTTVPI
jgi:hypothetical protein